MSDVERKELEGRYAARLLFSADTYFEFTKPLFERYDALSTGYSKEYGMLCEMLEEFKAYNDPAHIRYSTGTTKNIYYDFRLDYDKCASVVGKAEEKHRIPLLRCIFWDYALVWNLNKTDWRKNTWIGPVNKYGMDYKRAKERKLQSCLPLEGPEGPVCKIAINDPVALWKRVAEEIRKDYPDYTPSWEKNNG